MSYFLHWLQIPGRWRPWSPMTRLLLYHLELLYKGTNVDFIGGPQLARIKHLDLLDESTHQSINMPEIVVKNFIVHYSCFKIFFFFFFYCFVWLCVDSQENGNTYHVHYNTGKPCDTITSQSLKFHSKRYNTLNKCIREANNAFCKRVKRMRKLNKTFMWSIQNKFLTLYYFTLQCIIYYTAFLWLGYCRYGVKHKITNQ